VPCAPALRFPVIDSGDSIDDAYLPVTPSGDLDSFVAQLYLDTKPAAERLDVFPQGVDLGTINVTVLDAGDPVLADMQAHSQLDLREVRGFTELPSR
jgi:hypothetical protein